MTPETARLIRFLDAALAQNCYIPPQDVHAVENMTALGFPEPGSVLAAWKSARTYTQARVLTFLAQRTGPDHETAALARVSENLGVDLATAMPDPVLAAVVSLEERADPRAALRVILEVAAWGHTPESPLCGFCRIAMGWDDKVQIVEERDETIAFVPRDPTTGEPSDLVGGHWLVIPRVHVPSAVSVPSLSGLVFEHTAELARQAGPDHMNLIFNVGRLATATVDHLHGHIVPREEGDGFRLPWDPHARQNRFFAPH